MNLKLFAGAGILVVIAALFLAGMIASGGLGPTLILLAVGAVLLAALVAGLVWLDDGVEEWKAGRNRRRERDEQGRR
jgi:hypothetical protein